MVVMVPVLEVQMLVGAIRMSYINTILFPVEYLLLIVVLEVLQEYSV